MAELEDALRLAMTQVQFGMVIIHTMFTAYPECIVLKQTVMVARQEACIGGVGAETAELENADP